MTSALAEPGLPLPDIEQLKRAQYDILPPYAAQYAEKEDVALPLWSLTHTFLGSQSAVLTPENWKINWTNAASLYIYNALTHEEIARFSGLSLRAIEAKSGKYGWKQAQRTFRLMRDNEDVPKLSDLAVEARRRTIDEFLTNAGYEVGRHAMQALLQNADRVEPRDVPGLLQAAMKLLSMGEKIPSDYKFSRVENDPQPATNVNILNISDDKAAEILGRLRERARVLEDAGALGDGKPSS